MKNGNITIIPAKNRSYTDCETERQLRVAAYCRVSTEEENQKNSYSAQISYYTEYINANPKWKFAGIFADEGISGTRTKNRTQFNNMISIARKKGIDLILCKSISRFARNTVDCLDYIRELKSLGINVIFEKENINTGTVSSEFAISLYASFAQAESESISKNVLWGIEKSFREGNVRYQMSRTLGYRMGMDGKPYIVEEEAAIVRRIFELYAQGHSAEEIAAQLTALGAKRRSGSSVWKRFHVYQILKNEKYVGDALLQKTCTVNCLTHERAKNVGQKPMYLVQGCHEGIIERSMFDAVRLELEKRKRRREHKKEHFDSDHTRYSLSRCLVCPFCGSFYKRCTWVVKEGKVGVWRCGGRLTGNGCRSSFSYRESKLQSAILSAVNSMMGSNAERSPGIREHLNREFDSLGDGIAESARELAEVETERNLLLSSASSGSLDKVSAGLSELNRTEAMLVDRIDDLKQRRVILKKELTKSDNADRLFGSNTPVNFFDETLLPRYVTRIDAVGKNEILVVFANGAEKRSKLE